MFINPNYDKVCDSIKGYRIVDGRDVEFLLKKVCNKLRFGRKFVIKFGNQPAAQNQNTTTHS